MSILTCAAATRADDDAAAIERGTKYLLSTLDPNGRCRYEFPAGHRLYGSKTATCVYTLLNAGVQPREPVLRRAIEWLGAAELTNTPAVSWRLCAMAGIREDQARAVMQKDLGTLLKAAGVQGGYGESLDGNEPSRGDTLSTALAVMALHAAEEAGAAVPPEHWRRVAAWWPSQQQEDGGWNYAWRPDVRKSYGSATAAAVASVQLCAGPGRDEDGAAAAKALDSGLAWLVRRYSPQSNPVIGDSEYYDWLFHLSRLAHAGGLRLIAGQDWFAQGRAQLLARQSHDGSWGYDGGVGETCRAMIVLQRGRGLLAVAKLRYDGAWNTRPRDMANLSRWLGVNYERAVAWQIVDANMPLEMWQDSPVLYISGGGRFQPAEALAQRLRAFVLQGGMIVSDTADGSNEFTLDMQRLYQRLFSDYPLRPLDAGHPVFKASAEVKPAWGLMGVSNGVRTLAIHSAGDLSLALHKGRAQGQGGYELMANIHVLATDHDPLRFVPPQWPAGPAPEPNATLAVARVKYEGNWDPEPLAWGRLAALVAQRHRLRLDVTPVAMEQLDARRWPLAAWTGTESISLTVQQAAAVKKYLGEGGTLLIDAAGGSEAFAKSVQQRVLPLMADTVSGLEANDPLVAGLGKGLYRRQFAAALGSGAANARLTGGFIEKRLAVIFSRDDITAGLAGCGGYRIAGYSPAAAVGIVTRVVLRAAAR